MAKSCLEGDGDAQDGAKAAGVRRCEMGTNTSLSPLRAWSRRGERACYAVPRNRGKNTTLLSSMSVEGMGPSLAITGSVDAQVFEAYLERVLL